MSKFSSSVAEVAFFGVTTILLQQPASPARARSYPAGLQLSLQGRLLSKHTSARLAEI